MSGKVTVTTDEFVSIWQDAASLAEVVQLTGLSYTVVCNRASQLRMRGYPLHYWKQGPKTKRASERDPRKHLRTKFDPDVSAG